MSDKDNETLNQKPDEDASVSKANLSGFASVGGEYFIDLSKHIPEYSNKYVKAYYAGVSQSSPRGFIAMICNPSYTSRTNLAKAYQTVDHPGLPKLMKNGRCVMPDKTSRYCYIYRDNLGKRLHEKEEDFAKGMKAERVIEQIFIPIYMILKSLQQRDITHGNIRATNLYSGEEGHTEKFILGDCLSAPSSLHQPATYLTIDRAMASPIGRGEDTIRDDLYALGVLLVMHMRNFDPMRHKSDEEIISAKIVQGSYGALIGSTDRLSGGISDLLRGLLQDDPKARITMEEIDEWLDGKRIPPRQPVKHKKAIRALDFNGTHFFYTRTLVFRMMQNSSEAMKIIDNNELKHWVDRSLDNPDMLDRMEAAISSAQESGTGVGYADRLLPRISVALDPEAPIRYRDLSFHMSALGNAMMLEFIEKKDLSQFEELFASGIIYFWIRIAADMHMDVSESIQVFDKIRNYMRQKGLVFGIERCLYFANKSTHCLSPLVSEYFATDVVDYLIALDNVAEKYNGRYPDTIIDKHAACFLISRDQKLIDQHVFNLSSKEPHRRALSTIKILSNIQKFNNAPKTPFLTEWLASIADCVIERHHDRTLQKKIRADLVRAKSTGVIADILHCIDNAAVMKKDQALYKKALITYRQLENELRSLRKKLEKPKFFAERSGLEWSVTISGILSSIIVVAFLLMHYSGGG